MHRVLSWPRVSQGRLVQIAEKVYCLESAPAAASNAGLVVGDRTTFVFDSRVAPELGREWRSAAAAMSTTPDPQVVLANSHFHGDHWFGNAGFDGDILISSEWTYAQLRRAWREQVQVFSNLRESDPTELVAGEPILPWVGVRGALQLDLDGTRVRLWEVGPAHTPGDLIAWLPEERVLFTGDLVFNGHWPVLWDADPCGWLSALDSLRSLHPDTVVPGHGAAGGPAVIDEMIDCLLLLHKLAKSPEDALSQRISNTRFAKWLHPERIAPSITQIKSLKNTPTGTSK